MAVPNTLARAKFGDYVADFDSFELRKHGTRLKLQDQPFQILKILVQRSGQLVTRQELCAELWPDSTFVDFEAGLNAAVRRLRDALCDSAEEARYIQTVPRHGYRFIAPVEILGGSLSFVRSGELAAAAAENERTDVGATEKTAEFPTTLALQARGMWRRTPVVAFVLLLAMGLGAMVLRPNLPARHSREVGSLSIAVLPLQNLSGNPAEDYFAEGMTDALITNLAQSGSLKVISSNSSLRYKNPHKGIPEIGRELNVALILKGSIARLGDRVRVSVQLIDTATDQHLWARQYDRDMYDVLQLQSDIASAVTAEVTGKLISLDKGPLSVRTVNPEAYEAYLKGEYFLDKWTVEGFEKAKSYFEQTIQLDPSFADGYAGLAEYYGTVAFLGYVSPRQSWLKSEELLAKALEMDNSSSKAHSLFGMLKLNFRCDRAAAEKELNQALQLNPGDMRALDYHSYYLLEIGRIDEAIAEKRIVLEHDPLRVITNAELGLYFLQAGRNDEAIEQFKKTLELEPSNFAAHGRLGWAYAQKQQYDQAVIETRKAISLNKTPAGSVSQLGEIYARWGKRQEALDTIRQLQLISKQRYVAPNLTAVIYSRLGEKNVALAWLEKAKPEDDPKISDPAFDSLRSDPQFKTLETRLRPNSSCPAL